MSVDSIGDYHFIETSADEGDFYVAYTLEHMKTKQKYLGYLIHRKKMLYSPYISRLRKILEIQRSCNYPLIQQIYDVIIDGDMELIVFEYKYRLLLQLYSNGETIFESHAKKIFFQMVLAVSYLHKNLIANLDLQPNAFYFTQSGIIKLSNFSFSNYFEPGFLITAEPGNINYSAPEVFKGPFDPFKADIWSLGMILYSMLAGDCPITGQNSDEIIAKLKEMKEFPIPTYLSDESAEFLRLILQIDPTKRPNITQLIEHPYLQSLIYTKCITLQSDLEKSKERLISYANMKSIKIKEFKDNKYKFKFNFNTGNIFNSVITLLNINNIPNLKIDVLICENQNDLTDFLDAFQYLLGNKN